MTSASPQIRWLIRVAALLAVAVAVVLVTRPVEPRAAPAVAAPAGAAAPAQPRETVSQNLRAKVKRLLRGVGGASGVYVYDLTAGAPVATLNPGKKRILASNAKLFTTAATLDRLTSTGRFRTTVHSDGTVAAGILTGNLYLRGGGDPLFGSKTYIGKRYGSAATVETLAGLVALSGITRVTGHVYGDESALDEHRGTAKYSFHHNGEIGGQLSALVFDKGFTSKGRSWQSDPPRFAAVKFRNALEDAGVRVDDTVGVSATPVGATEVTGIDSMNAAQLITLTNKPSDNYIAEMLLKNLSLGGPPGSASGSSAEGATAARRFAAGLGSRVSLGDGSGLSRQDRAAPREVVDLLRAMYVRPDFEDYYDSLSIPGVDGTLHKRMKNTMASKRCGAKTGTLSNVSALSGYCTSGDGHILAFAILQNAVWPYAAHGIQDKIVKTLAR